MKKLLSIILIILLIGLTYQYSTPSIPARIDKLVSEYVINHNFMGSILVADKGKVIFAKGYGLANVKQNVLNSPQTKFLIGSITKQFTAMLVMQLVEKGKLKLDNTISEFLPYFPRNTGDKITIEMLLNHTSGLPHPDGIESYYHFTKKEDYIKKASKEKLHFEPGEKYKYSNVGYYILGVIIEKVTGKTYEEFLIEKILKPLGMSNTGCNSRGLALENRAYSYFKLSDKYLTWSDTRSFDPSIMFFSAGFMYSTVEDLFKFSKALSTNKLLTKKYMDKHIKMRTVKSLPPIRNISKKQVTDLFGTSGSGFIGEISIKVDPDTKDTATLYWHDGTMKFFKGYHYHFSEPEQYIIILSNCSLRCEGDEMALKIHQLLNNKSYEHIHFKHSLIEYLSEEVLDHAGIPAALSEYKRLKNDTFNFNVPDADYLVQSGLYFAGKGDLDNAILILQTVISEFPKFWKAYDALGETYLRKSDKTNAIRNFKKSLELNPGNTKTIKLLKKLENK